MRGVLALSYLKVSLYIRVISRNVEILSLALIIPRLILGSTSDPIYNTFLFSGYMSLAGDNPDLKKFIVSLRSRMLRYDLTCLCLYLAMSMAINGGIILSEQDLLDALIL